VDAKTVGQETNGRTAISQMDPIVFFLNNHLLLSASMVVREIS